MLFNIRFQKNNENDVPNFIYSFYFKEGYRKFQNFYAKWLNDINVEEELHPWDQFKTIGRKLN